MITKPSTGYAASCDVCHRDFKAGYPIKKEDELYYELQCNQWAVIWTKEAKKVYCPYCLGLKKPSGRRKQHG